MADRMTRTDAPDTLWPLAAALDGAEVLAPASTPAAESSPASVSGTPTVVAAVWISGSAEAVSG